jgi:hypothetical protein
VVNISVTYLHARPLHLPCCSKDDPRHTCQQYSEWRLHQATVQRLRFSFEIQPISFLKIPRSHLNKLAVVHIQAIRIVVNTSISIRGSLPSGNATTGATGSNGRVFNVPTFKISLAQAASFRTTSYTGIRLTRYRSRTGSQFVQQPHIPQSILRRIVQHRWCLDKNGKHNRTDGFKKQH